MKKGIKENYAFLSLEKRQIIFSWIVILPLYFGILKNWCIIPLTKLFFVDIAAAEWAPMVAMIRNIIILVLLSIVLRDYIRKSFEDVKEKSIIHTLKWLGRGMKYFLFACIVNGIVYVVVNQIVGVELSEQSTYNQALVDSFRISHRGLAFLSNVLIAPIVEELVFRVILFRPLRRIHTNHERRKINEFAGTGNVSCGWRKKPCYDYTASNIATGWNLGNSGWYCGSCGSSRKCFSTFSGITGIYVFLSLQNKH